MSNLHQTLYVFRTEVYNFLSSGIYSYLFTFQRYRAWEMTFFGQKWWPTVKWVKWGPSGISLTHRHFLIILDLNGFPCPARPARTTEAISVNIWRISPLNYVLLYTLVWSETDNVVWYQHDPLLMTMHMACRATQWPPVTSYSIRDIFDNSNHACRPYTQL